MTASAATAEDFSAGRERQGWRAAISREEISDLLRVSNLRGFASVAVNWGIVFAALAVVARWPNPLTIPIALFVIGARQLGLAVLMHDASHRALFRPAPLNDWVGNWLCAYPVWSNLEGYRHYHLKHHAKTGTLEDPDLALILPFPTTRASLTRKVLRDLTGRTGLKFAAASFRRTYYATDDAGRRAFRGVVVTNLVLFAIIGLTLHPALYLLWVGAWLTTNTLVTRIRSIAEHALTNDALDPLRNTRTIVARWWERLLFAPNRVNFHLEHHLLMTVPHYRLPDLHRLLRERGVLDEACVENSYIDLLRRASAGNEKPAAREGVLPARVPPF
ncbi:MAG: fatty acid desaturase family protein [Myxococcales bacterium]|nr:fatty acid desaturase family protein [Myxococcales bacterium]